MHQEDKTVTQDKVWMTIVAPTRDEVLEGAKFLDVVLLGNPEEVPLGALSVVVWFGYFGSVHPVGPIGTSAATVIAEGADCRDVVQGWRNKGWMK